MSPWPFAAAWQYSSSGNVPGIGSRIDVNWFYGDAVTWAKYAGGSGTTHTVTPPAGTANSDTPVGDTESLARAVIRGEYGNLPQRRPRVDATYGAGTYAKEQAIVNGSTVSAGNAGGRVYVVKPGNCLSRVFPGNWQTVARANGIANPNLIYPGQRIRY